MIIIKINTPIMIMLSLAYIPQVRWTDIGGMAPVKQCLREVVEWPLQYPKLFQRLGVSPPQGVLLYGPPGCSKTLMAKALATESGMNFLAVKGSELMSKWLGESEKAIQTLFKRARAVSPCIVFFDEIDALASRRGEGGSGVNDRVLAQLLTELDGIGSQRVMQRHPEDAKEDVRVEELVKQARSGEDKITGEKDKIRMNTRKEREDVGQLVSAALYSRVIVVAATNRPDMLDPALMRPGRVDRKVYVPPPDEGSRKQILELELSKMPISESGDGDGRVVDISYLVKGTLGFSGAEVVAVCQEAAMVAIDEGLQCIDMGHLEQAMKAIKPQITQEMLSYYEELSF